MRKRIEWEWEVLDEFTKRAKVIGGWVLLHHTTVKGQVAESMVMIPDRDHEHEILIPKADPVIERSAIAKDFEPSA